MGRRGPPKTPTKILQMRGSWLAKTRDGEPDAGTFTATCPDWMPAHGRECWDQTVAILGATRVLGSGDARALALYCSLWAMFMDAQAFIAKHGTDRPIRGADGKVVSVEPYPQVARLLKVVEQLTRLGNHFGLTPSARASLGGNGKPLEKSPSSQYFA